MAIIRVTNVPSTALSDDVITSAKIADGTIAVSDLANDSVTADKIASNAVTSAKIADSNITTAKVADGAITTGHMHSSVPLGVRNLIINGDMRIAQRGTSFTSNLENTYTLDRWKIHDRLCTYRLVTQESFSTGSVSTFGKEVSNYLRATFSNDSGATPPFVMQAIEDVKSVAGETVTISFWAKADSAQDIELHYSQQFGGGGSSEVTAIIDTFTLTTSWVKYTTTVTIPSISGKTVGTSSNLRIDWRMPANTAITYDMTLVQLEVGDTATPFEHRPYDMELQRCQRYYEVSGTGTNFGSNLCVAQNTTRANCACAFPVAKRATPTVSVYSSNGANTVVAPGVSGVTVTIEAHNIYGIQFLSGTFDLSYRAYLFYYIADSEL